MMHPYRAMPRQEPLPGIAPPRKVARVIPAPRVPAGVRTVETRAHEAPPPVRIRFRVHLACLAASVAVLIIGLLLPADVLVLGSPVAESIALAVVERIFAL